MSPWLTRLVKRYRGIQNSETKEMECGERRLKATNE